MIFAETTGFADRVRSNKAGYREVLHTEFKLVNQRFEEHFKKDLSGRKADDTGLNKRSGKLYGSLDGAVTVNPQSVTAEVQNRDATYWYWHQKGASATRTSAWGKPTRPYQWTLPKRLFFWEYFTEHAPLAYADAWRIAARRLAA